MLRCSSTCDQQEGTATGSICSPLLTDTGLSASRCKPLTLCSHIRPRLLYRTVKNCQYFTLCSPINYHWYVEVYSLPQAFFYIAEISRHRESLKLWVRFLLTWDGSAVSGVTLLAPHCNVAPLCSQAPSPHTKPPHLVLHLRLFTR